MSVGGMVPFFRQALRPLLTKTCTVIPVVNTTDTKGGYTQSWPGPGTEIPCNCQEAGSGSAGDLSWSADADAYQVLTTSDVRIENGSHILVDGMTLVVVANTPGPGIDALHRFDCIRTTEGTS